MEPKQKISVSKKQIDLIAEELDCGLRVFYNFKTGEINSFIDIDEAYDVVGEILEEWEKIEENWADYYEFQKMDSSESFSVMEGFANTVTDQNFMNRLINALNKPKPFRNFKYEIGYNLDYREEWFKFKHHRLVEWVKNQIEAHNSEDF